MHVEPHLPLSELQQLELEEPDAGRSQRLRIITLALQGWTASAVAKSAGLPRRICQRWAARYNAEGLAGLDDLRGGDRWPPVLSPE